MIYKATKIKDVYVVVPEPVEDERGLFSRTWCQYEFENNGLTPGMVQCSTSFNHKPATLRGLHFQRAPHMEAKLVRCTRGAAFDVAVDIREESETFGQWVATEITADNRHAHYIPEGVAHGFQTLVPETEIFYQISTFHAPEFAAGLRWDDPDIAIDWPETNDITISEKDGNHPTLRDSAPLLSKS